MRFGLEIQDFSDDFRESDFKVFAGAIQSGGAVKAFNAKGLADITQGELKHLEETAKSLGAKGLAFIKSEGGEWKSPILKFLSDAEQGNSQDQIRSRRWRHRIFCRWWLGKFMQYFGVEFV